MISKWHDDKRMTMRERESINDNDQSCNLYSIVVMMDVLILVKLPLIVSKPWDPELGLWSASIQRSYSGSDGSGSFLNFWSFISLTRHPWITSLQLGFNVSQSNSLPAGKRNGFCPGTIFSSKANVRSQRAACPHALMTVLKATMSGVNVLHVGKHRHSLKKAKTAVKMNMYTVYISSCSKTKTLMHKGVLARSTAHRHWDLMPCSSAL